MGLVPSQGEGSLLITPTMGSSKSDLESMPLQEQLRSSSVGKEGEQVRKGRSVRGQQEPQSPDSRLDRPAVKRERGRANGHLWVQSSSLRNDTPGLSLAYRSLLRVKREDYRSNDLILLYIPIIHTFHSHTEFSTPLAETMISTSSCHLAAPASVPNINPNNNHDGDCS